MPFATLQFRHLAGRRTDLFTEGLQRLGYELRKPTLPSSPEDLLVIWNRRDAEGRFARQFEKAGGRVIVAENGYIGEKTVALALGHHNGAGSWPEGGPERLEALGIQLEPWRSHAGGHLLLLPQRGIGEAGVAMPNGWANKALQRARERRNPYPVRLRRHPGPESPPLAPDLAGAWACLTWGSGAAIKALAAGIPVFYDFPRWIGGQAARFGLKGPPVMDDEARLAMFRRLAWAQWRPEEIASGEAFAWLLSR